MCREFSPPRSDRDSQLVCALKYNVRTSLRGNDNIFGRTIFYRGLGTTEREPQKILVGTHQQKFKSVRLSNTRFGTF